MIGTYMIDLVVYDPKVERCLEWIRTDPQGIQDDIARLGKWAAAKYNVWLSDQDPAWRGMTVKDMLAAFEEMEN